MLKLVKTNEKYYIQYKEMMDEWNMEGSRIAPWPLGLKYHTKEYFLEMLKRVNELSEKKKEVETQVEKSRNSIDQFIGGILVEEDNVLATEVMKAKNKLPHHRCFHLPWPNLHLS